mmetsp:Transcript_6089/g.37757  ORF Transcript_6089/g.37757 Transcript_6089/m.37757 type:complete len:498 (+) Transcript_6089:75-1568(+)
MRRAMPNVDPNVLRASQEQVRKETRNDGGVVENANERDGSWEAANLGCEGRLPRHKHVARDGRPADDGWTRIGNCERSFRWDGSLTQRVARAWQMKNMTPEQWERAMEQMRSMSTEDMIQQMKKANQAGVSGQMNARVQYELNASKQLKEEGNAFHRSGNFQEAAEKYARAKNNLSTHSSDDAKSVKKACTLNLASCYLKTGQYELAVEMCTEVLAVEDTNLKALFRRGQAQHALGKRADALVDIRKASKTWPDDETVIEYLRKLEGEAAEHNIGEAEVKSAQTRADEFTANARERVQCSTSGASNYAAALEQMRSNPDLLEKMSESLETMSDADLENFKKTVPGMENATPEMMRTMGRQMKNMTSEDLERLSEMAKSMPQGASQEEQMQAMQDRMKDPEAMKTLSKMMQNMSPDQLKEMGQTMGKNLSEEEAVRFAQSIKSMKPEHIEKMLKVATALHSAGLRAKKAKQWVMARPALVLAIIVFLVAVLLRRWGWI